jgi:hypothetical protein
MLKGRNPFSPRRTRIANELSALEGAVSDLERKALAFCNCRLATAFHTGGCLDAILKGQQISCPVHEFRTLGIFFPLPLTTHVLPSDQRFCACPVVAPCQGDPSFVKSFQDPRDELSLQLGFIRTFVKTPFKFHELEFANSYLLKVARNKDNGGPDALTEDEHQALELAYKHAVARRDWWRQTGKLEPRSLALLKLLSSRYLELQGGY